MNAAIATTTRKIGFSIIGRLASLAIILMAALASAFAQGGTITIQGQAGTFATIQDAINAAQPRATVIVDGGDHQENLFINKPLQLMGQNNAAINPTTGTPVSVNNPAGPVAINGLTIKIPGIQVGINYDGLDTDPSNTGTILKCRFIGGGSAILAKEASFRIVLNQFSGFFFSAIQVSGISGNTDRKIRISLNTFNGGAVVNNQIQVLPSAVLVSNGNIQVDGNQMTNIFRGVRAIGCAGLVASNGFTDAAQVMDLTNSPNLLVERNTSETSAAFSAAINIVQQNTFAMRAIASNGVIVRNNTFIGGNSGIIITQQSTGVTIDSNIVRDTVPGFQGGGNGISLTLSSVAEIHNNNIENNPTFGVISTGSTVNATNNWWGAANGPSGAGGGNGDAVTSGVTFIPFLTAPNPNAGA